MRALTASLLFSAQLLAQQVLAPTPEPVGPPRGENTDGYNVVNSFETGYRFSLIDGNLGKYRSDVNYRNGIRLLGSNLTVNSRNGHGRFFDEIVLTTLGLGNDPYESATLRIQKNRWYRYDMMWRLNEYYNPALTISYGEHLYDTRRRLQDHDFVLLPQSRFKLRLGYTRNSQTGPALSTVQQFSSFEDEFPVFANVRRQTNEYRVGADVELAGFKLTFLHRREYFKEDTPYALDSPSAGNNPADLATLGGFRRSEPYHGSTPGWLATLRTEHKSWAVNGRFTYSGGRRGFILDESAFGTARFGADRNRQILVSGDARRPVITGDLSISVFPGDRITVVNNTSVHSTRIDGNAVYREINNAVPSPNVLNFQYLGIRTVTNSTDLHVTAFKWLGFRTGYQFSERRIRSIESFEVPPGAPGEVAASQDNRVHSGILGLRFQPIKPLIFNVDGEIGRADRPFYPISERNYHTISGRAQYRRRSLLLSANYRENFNANSISISSYGSRARTYGADASWSPRSWLGFDAGYSRLRLTTSSGIAFFAGAPNASFITGLQSLYFSNIHAANLGVRVAASKNVDLYVGYTRNQDTGDGRSSPAPVPSDPVSAVLIPVQTFPLTFDSPIARVSVRLNQKLRWNAGWQFYRYREEFGLYSVNQNYRAHTGYTSLLWSF
jgi:hypothetical protein